MWGKKDERFFSLTHCVVSDSSVPAPCPVSFSPISGILTSPPSMWVTHMCEAGVSCRAGSCSLCELGLLCVCLWTLSYTCVCVCVFISNPPGIHFYERSKPHQIHSKKRVTSSLVHHKLRVSNRPTASVEEGGGGIISPETAHRSNIPTFYHKTTSESTLGRSVASQALTAAPIQRFLPSLST